MAIVPLLGVREIEVGDTEPVGLGELGLLEPPPPPQLMIKTRRRMVVRDRRFGLKHTGASVWVQPVTAMRNLANVRGQIFHKYSY
jgi:hypothetical protein